MTKHKNKSLPPLRSLTKDQKWKLYKKMGKDIVNKYDAPVKFAFKASLLFFVLLLVLPCAPCKLYVAFASSMAIGVILG